MKEIAADLIAQYYRITDHTYLSLSPNAHFMNLGLWPAYDIPEAQINLVDLTLNRLKSTIGELKYDVIIEGGSGWGGSLPRVRLIFGDTPSYVGFNTSESQIQYSSITNYNATNFWYIQDSIENVVLYTLAGPGLFFSVEAVIHLPDKRRVFHALRQANVKAIALAEITTSDSALLLKEPLFFPSLRYLGSNDDYVEGITSAGYDIIDNVNISSKVFSPWASHLCNVSDKHFLGSKKILKNLKTAYSKLAQCANDKIVEYRIYTARLPK